MLLTLGVRPSKPSTEGKQSAATAGKLYIPVITSWNSPQFDKVSKANENTIAVQDLRKIPASTRLEAYFYVQCYCYNALHTKNPTDKQTG